MKVVMKVGVGICLVALVSLAWLGRHPPIFEEFQRKGVKLRPIKPDPNSRFGNRPQQFWIELQDRNAVVAAIKSSGYHRDSEPIVATGEPLAGSYTNRNHILRFLPRHTLEIEFMPYVGYKLSFFE